MARSAGLMRLFGDYARTRRGSASELVARMRGRELPKGYVFKLECFDLDEAICVKELLTDEEQRRAFVTWLEFPGRCVTPS